MNTINKFTIYGERCSGTNFLEEMMLNNFKNIKLTWEYNYKHFFGFHDFINNTNKNKNLDSVLFIGIIRNPIDWLYSFYTNQHQIPDENKELNKFLFNQFYSVKDENKTLNEMDINFITNKKYKNIFELRYVKNNYLINDMPKLVKNYILINYEDLLNNSEYLLNKIQYKFNLTFKYNQIKTINYYKKEKNIVFVPKKVNFTNDILNKIKKNLNIEQENKLYYEL